MESKKKWYLSKTVWGALLAGAATFAGILGFGFNVQGLDNEIVTMIGAAFAVYGRFKAVKPLK